MTFVVTLIALLIERFFDWTHVRHWEWFHSYEAAIMKRVSKKSPLLQLAFIVIPMLLVVSLLQFVIGNALYGFLQLVFQLFLLLYCLGPQNLWADAFVTFNALSSSSTNAGEKLKTAFGVNNTSSKTSLHTQLLNNIFIAANHRVFAVIFWYFVLGPVGAVLYRTVSLCCPEFFNKPEKSPLANVAHTVELALDWVPVRILTFIFALGGHFSLVFAAWRSHVGGGLYSSEEMLVTCGLAALDHDDKKIDKNSYLEKQAISLLDRSFIIALVAIAVGVLLI